MLNNWSGMWWGLRFPGVSIIRDLHMVAAGAADSHTTVEGEGGGGALVVKMSSSRTLVYKLVCL